MFSLFVVLLCCFGAAFLVSLTWPCLAPGAQINAIARHLWLSWTDNSGGKSEEKLERRDHSSGGGIHLAVRSVQMFEDQETKESGD